jgi:ribosomal protein S18 acetylase RimI-like enzyme
MKLGTCDIAPNAGRAVASTASRSTARIGMIQLLERPDAVEIGKIQIQPTHQGRGIGTRLLRDTIALAHAQRRKVSLATGLKNHRAFALYQRLGFRHVAQTETHNHMEYEPRS